MASIRAALGNNTDKNGMRNVMIGICHHQKTSYISTDIKVEPESFVKGKQIYGKGMKENNARILALINMYKERLECVENKGALTSMQLRDAIKDKPIKYVMLSSAFDEYESTLRTRSSLSALRRSRDLFTEYCKTDITLLSITPKTISGFHTYLQGVTYLGKHLQPTTIGLYMAMIRATLRMAVKHGNVEYKVNPFIDYSFPSAVVRDNSISVETLNAIKNFDTAGLKTRISIDMFMLSFYLGGMNFVDISKADFRNDRLTYIREKNKKRNHKTVIPILPQAREIIGKYMNKDGQLDLPFHQGNYIKQLVVIDNCLKRIQRVAELTEHVTMYSARKCFAQIGLNIGISDSIIDYILGHSPSNRGVIAHYSHVMPELAEEAMKLIIEFSEKPEDIKALFRKQILNKLYE